MTFKINEDYEYKAETGIIKIAGHEYTCCTDDDWMPPKEEKLGIIKSNGKGKSKDENPDYLQIDDKLIVIKPYTSKTNIFTKKVGWIRVESDDKKGYLKVTKTRLLPIIALIILGIAIVVLVYSLINGVAPKDAPAYLADQVGITNNNETNPPKANISYATYESTPDQTWKAGTKDQSITLSLPANVTYTDKDGKQKTDKNPVVAAPSIWVDLNDDGKFTKDECVFNAPKYDKNGNVTSTGDLLDPGKQITSIKLTKEIPAGTYKAQTVWTPRMAKGGAPANPMTFNWSLTVN